MAQDFAKIFYSSKAWLKCREGYIKSVHGLCEKCLKQGKVQPGLIVHHKIILTPENINDPDITFNWEHLEYNCLDCHNKEHHGSDGGITAEGLCFNEYGDLVISPP